MKDPSIIKLLMDPFALTPGFRGPDQPRSDKAEQDADLGVQTAAIRAIGNLGLSAPFDPADTDV